MTGYEIEVQSSTPGMAETFQFAAMDMSVELIMLRTKWNRFKAAEA
jgi:hypothetical protein